MSSAIVLTVLLLLGMYASVRKRRLTFAGAFGAGIIGALVYVGIGWIGIVLLCLFFLLGTLSTSWGRKKKEEIGVGESSGGRNLGQVFANGGLAGLLGILAFYYPSKTDLMTLLLAAGLSSATADTLSSELGTLYGKRFYNILTWKRDQKGLDGVISLEGTALGFVGSCLIAVVYTIFYPGWWGFICIVLAGTAGNLFDSVLGASVERKAWLGNDAVNFLNTLLAALLAWLIH